MLSSTWHCSATSEQPEDITVTKYLHLSKIIFLHFLLLGYGERKGNN